MGDQQLAHHLYHGLLHLDAPQAKHFAPPLLWAMGSSEERETECSLAVERYRQEGEAKTSSGQAEEGWNCEGRHSLVPVRPGPQPKRYGLEPKWLRTG